MAASAMERAAYCISWARRTISAKAQNSMIGTMMATARPMAYGAAAKSENERIDWSEEP